MIQEANKLSATHDTVVSLSYQLRSGSADGNIVETVDANNPLTFIFGVGQLLPKFEANVAGLTQGDTFEFSLSAVDAYGELIPENIVDLPIQIFETDGVLNTELVQLGKVVPMQDKDGNRYNGIIRQIETESIRVDFNHPLAGQNLFFKGEVVEVREVTPEDLDDCCDTDDCNSEGCSCGCSC